MTTTFAQGPRTRTHRAFHEDLARGHHVPFTTALHEDALCTRNSPKDEPRQGLVHMRTLQGEVPCTTASHEDEPCTRDSQTAVPCTRTLHKRGYQRAQGRASCEGFARGRSWSRTIKPELLWSSRYAPSLSLIASFSLLECSVLCPSTPV